MPDGSDPAPPPFLDVDHLLDESTPRSRAPMLGYVVGIFVLMVLLSTYATSHSAEGAQLVNLLSSLGMLGLVAALTGLTFLAARRARAEQQQIEAIEELVQLRRWADAANLLNSMLSRPTRTLQARIQALVFLASVLARYHRFSDAIHIYEHLLDLGQLDAHTVHALRLGRAMSLLREDRLVDADRAIGELRRGTDGIPSAGLALIEVYRDVKTGHPEEAIEIFSERLPVLRQQLGPRVADAYALVARAFDMAGRSEEAAQAYRNATCLADEEELHRRYPEIGPLRGRYGPMGRPAGG